MRKIFLCQLVFICLSFYFGVPTVLAQTTSLNIFPAILDIDTRLTDPAQNQITIKNTGSQPVIVATKVAKFFPNEQLLSKEAEAMAQYSEPTWLKVTPREIILAPAEEKKVQLTVLPEILRQPGGHYATVFFEPLIDSSQKKLQSSVVMGQVAALVFVKVPGQIQQQIQIESVAVNKSSFVPKVGFQIHIANSGNVHTFPTGSVEIKNIFHRKVATIPINAKIVMPNTRRDFDARWEPSWAVGLYTAEFSFNLDGDKKIVESVKKSFFLLPILYIVMLILILTIGAFFLIVFLHSNKLKLFIIVLATGRHPGEHHKYRKLYKRINTNKKTSKYDQ